MPSIAGRDEVVRLRDGGAQVVDVLPSDDFERLHIAGAINIPLRELGARAGRELDPARPVVVYCHDSF